MKLNVDCVRAVLLEMEKISYGQNLRPETLYSTLETFGKNDIDYSIIKLKEAGFIDAIICESDNGVARKIVIKDITCDGHQFLDNIREPSVWEKIIEKSGKAVSSIPTLCEAVAAIASVVSAISK